MWTAITYVSTGVTLVAFVVAVVAAIIRRQGLKQKELIETAAEEDRAALIDKTLEFGDKCLGARRTPGHIAAHLADHVDPIDHRRGIPVRAATGRTSTEGQHPHGSIGGSIGMPSGYRGLQCRGDGPGYHQDGRMVE